MASILRIAAAALLLFAGLAAAQEPTRAQVFLDSLAYRDGAISVPQAHVRLSLGDGFRYLDKTDARRVLEEFWGNPEDDSVLGMLVPTDAPLGTAESWAVILTWNEDGHVSDADAAQIDYAALLADMQRETQDANPALTAAGYPTVELLGWAQPPRYDAVAKRLLWAKHLQFAGHPSGSLNYDIRVLGRQGYLRMNAVADINHLDRVNAGMVKVLNMAEFDAGYRYTDFNHDTDKTAAYGLAALVGGGLAAKTGLLAKLGLLVAKSWKLLLIAGAGIVMLISKVRKKGRSGEGPVN